MPDLSLTDTAATTASPFDVVTETQLTLPLAADSAPLSVVKIDSNGKWAKAAAAAGTAGRDLYVLLKSGKAGQSVTGAKTFKTGKFNLDALAFGAKLFTSVTAGAIADATSTNAVVIAHVVPAHGTSNPAAPDKLLQVDCA